MLNGSGYISEGVHVFDLHLFAKGAGASQPYRHVGVTSQRAFFHVAVANLQIAHQLLDLDQEVVSLFRGTHIRLGHNFNKRYPCPVEIHQGIYFPSQVNGLSGILFHMDSRKGYAFLLSAGQHNWHTSAYTDRALVLGQLITFWKVRVEIIFSGKYISPSDLGITSQTHFNGKFHCLFVNFWQGTWMSQGNHRYIRVG